MTVKNTDRKAPVTHNNLLSAYLLAGGGSTGCDKVSLMLVNHTKPVETLERVIGALTDAGQDAEELSALRDIFSAAKSNGVKGRKPPKTGDTKLYSVQQVEDGDMFIRLPLGTLRVEKGEKISVCFTAGEITVTKRLTDASEA
jgi:hypothetical protein